MAGLDLRQAVERTHAPIGLELGGDGPEAVAVAIVAELQQTFAAAPGKMLGSRRMHFAEVARLLENGTPHPGGPEHCASTYFGGDDLSETLSVVTQ